MMYSWSGDTSRKGMRAGRVGRFAATCGRLLTFLSLSTGDSPILASETPCFGRLVLMFSTSDTRGRRMVWVIQIRRFSFQVTSLIGSTPRRWERTSVFALSAGESVLLLEVLVAGVDNRYSEKENFNNFINFFFVSFQFFKPFFLHFKFFTFAKVNNIKN